jgi:hypothetical protein
MTRPPTESLPPTDDTPVDERPPYAEPSRWRLVALALVVVLVLAVILYGVARGVRGLCRLVFDRPPREGVIMFTANDQYLVGTTYRCAFYDDTYRQLVDEHIAVTLATLHGPAADATLDRLARECRAEVERRDSQRCFRPRLVVLDVDGRALRSWSVTA